MLRDARHLIADDIERAPRHSPGQVIELIAQGGRIGKEPIQSHNRRNGGENCQQAVKGHPRRDGHHTMSTNIRPDV